MVKWGLLALCLAWFAAGNANVWAETLTIAAAEERQICPRCGYENEPDLNYCIKCGAPLKGEAPGEKIYCPQCGAENAEGAKFCIACGYALRVEKAGVRPPSAPAPHPGVYFTGGLASYGGIELNAENERTEADMGTSWSVGGGFVLPVWHKAGTVAPSLELSTDAGYSTADQGLTDRVGRGEFRTGLVPFRETVIFGIGIGRGKTIMPFGGFGAGAGILTWEYRGYGSTFDEGTTVKPLFDIPFGCEFYPTRNFALGARADYLIIPGNIEMEWVIGPYMFPAEVSVPDVFLFSGTARLCF